MSSPGKEVRSGRLWGIATWFLQGSDKGCDLGIMGYHEFGGRESRLVPVCERESDTYLPFSLSPATTLVGLIVFWGLAGEDGIMGCLCDEETSCSGRLCSIISVW